MGKHLLGGHQPFLESPCDNARSAHSTAILGHPPVFALKACKAAFILRPMNRMDAAAFRKQFEERPAVYGLELGRSFSRNILLSPACIRASTFRGDRLSLPILKAGAQPVPGSTCARTPGITFGSHGDRVSPPGVACGSRARRIPRARQRACLLPPIPRHEFVDLLIAQTAPKLVVHNRPEEAGRTSGCQPLEQVSLRSRRSFAGAFQRAVWRSASAEARAPCGEARRSAAFRAASSRICRIASRLPRPRARRAEACLSLPSTSVGRPRGSPRGSTGGRRSQIRDEIGDREVVSSCPIALTTGSGEAAIARATTSSLNSQRSSMLPRRR